MTRSWKIEIIPHVKNELADFKSQGIKPTLRTIFYRLASNGVLRNVQGDYTYLSKITAECRKRDVVLDRTPREVITQGCIMNSILTTWLYKFGLLVQYKKQRHRDENNIVVMGMDGYGFKKKYILRRGAVLDVDCFADDTRGAIQDFHDDYRTPEQHIKDSIDFLENLPIEYKSLIPKWHNQEYHVELWTEKNAMVGTFRSILKDLDVRIVYNRGFDSISNTYRTVKRLHKAWMYGKKVRILYFGDLDPSGDAMDEIMNENLDVFFDVSVHRKNGLYDFKRIGVLYDHIKQYKLKMNPDKKVLAKLGEDPRKERFKAKYGIAPGKETDNQLFQYEIDALAAADPAGFKKMVLDEIKPYYDNEIYNKLLSDAKHSEGQISIQVIKNVREFLDEQNIKSMWNWIES